MQRDLRDQVRPASATAFNKPYTLIYILLLIPDSCDPATICDQDNADTLALKWLQFP